MRLREIIEQMNTLFESEDLADADMSLKLREQAAANTWEQFLGRAAIQKAILALLARDLYDRHGREGAA